mmetsp:Transcript_75226/g.126581  ORF Transcript_75226/g.126581 Transcript_75226/m.126581 type:complete len:93 (+) Transcript_75226:172-450(+)
MHRRVSADLSSKNKKKEEVPALAPGVIHPCLVLQFGVPGATAKVSVCLQRFVFSLSGPMYQHLQRTEDWWHIINLRKHLSHLEMILDGCLCN